MTPRPTWSILDGLNDVSTSPIIHYFLGLNSVVEYRIVLEVKGRKRYLSSLLFG